MRVGHFRSRKEASKQKAQALEIGSGVLQLSIVKLQVEQWALQSHTIYRWLAKVFNGEEHPRNLQSEKSGF